jgi:hypothetical protein
MDEGENGGLRLVWNRERAFVGEPFETIAAHTTPMLIKGVLPARGVGYIVGPTKAGKTFVAVDWTIKVACGATVMGRKTRQVGVVYVAAEDPDGVRSRITAWKRKNPRESFTPFQLIGRRVNLLDEEQRETFVAELHAIDEQFQQDGFRLGLIVFDTFSKCIPGAEENSSEKMSLALDAMQDIADEFKALALALAHHGKDSGRGIRGWSGLDAGSDATISVERDEEMPDQRRITLSKVKNGKDGDVIGFTLERQNLGIQDEDGEDLWSCVVQYDVAAPEAAKGKVRRKALSTNAEIVMAALGYLIDKEIRQAPPAMAEGVRSGTWAVRRADLSLDAASRGLKFDGENDAAYRQRFGRAVTELVGAKKVRCLGDAIWPI